MFMYSKKQCFGVLLCGLLLFVHNGGAFDTGHHWDITYTALSMFGFSPRTIRNMQVMNWMTDFYSVSIVAKITDFQLLHCDTLRNTTESACYWRQLSANMRKGVEKVANESDALGMTALLAYSLHAVQDFYSHSSWVETHPRNGTCDCFRTDTFFKYQNNLTGMPDIYSDACEMCERVENRINSTMVPHGDYCYGINKDSFVRPNHEEAFIYAFIASLEWINSTRSWCDAVNSSFWASVVNYQGVDAEGDWDAGYKISSWLLTGANNDGHWKGSGSGNGVRGLLKYLWWALGRESKLVREVRDGRLFQILTNPSPYSPCTISNDTSIIPISKNFTSDMRVIILRTIEIYKTDQHSLSTIADKNFTNTASSDFWLYARINIGDQLYIEPTQRKVLRPFWTAMKVIKLSDLDPVDPKVNISYGLFQENALEADTALDINLRNKNATSAGPVNFVYHINTHQISGDVNGVFDSYDNPAVVAGYQSYIKFYITTSDLSTCGNGLYYGPIGEHNTPQCPNTAAAQNGAPFICSVKGAKEANTEFRNSVIAIVLPIGYFFLAGFIACIMACIAKGRANKRKRKYVSISNLM